MLSNHRSNEIHNKYRTNRDISIAWFREEITENEAISLMDKSLLEGRIERDKYVCLIHRVIKEKNTFWQEKPDEYLCHSCAFNEFQEVLDDA